MGDLLSLSSGRLTLTVDPQNGGRLAQLTFEGRPLLSGPEVNPDNWGATFWTSPQADWGWPPLAEVDHLPYEVLTREPSHVRLQSREATLGQEKFRVEKRFSAVSGDCFDATYVIESGSRTPFSMAAWEISRVGPGGLTFFPTGRQELTPIAPHGALALEKTDGISYYDHSRFSLGRSLKLHADAGSGFLAHVDRGHLILKMFVDCPPEAQAPGEGEVEIFANEDGRYVEIEVQGPYVRIDPGGHSSFTVRTHVCEVPRGATRAELVILAQSLRQRLLGDGAN